MRNKSNLWPYQKIAVEAIKNNTHYGLLLEMGLGKTVSTLTAINELIWEELDVDTVLIVGPKRVAENVWTSEIEEWEHLKNLRISRIMGNEKQRRAALAEKSEIYTISRDNLAWLIGIYGGGKLPFDMLVIDESSSFKNPKSLRFKALKPVLPHFKRVVILTGTPAPNSLMDLWPQIYMLDRGERLGKTITKYREEYFKPGKRNGAIIYSYDIISDGEQRIHEKISDICMSMKAKDFLNLPERIDNVIKIPLPDKLRKEYNQFEEEAVLELFSGEKEITAVNAAALTNKLLQFANGAVYDEDKNYHVVHDLKLDALEEIVEESGGKPILVAWTYRSDMERIKKKFKNLNPRELKTSQDIKDWNEGKIQMLLMHPASGGHGLNLQHGGNIMVWFGQTWSLELLQQFIARLHRQGQTSSVIVHYLVLEGTMDLDVLKAQDRKARGQEGLMQAVKFRIDKYVRNHSK